MSPRLRRSLSWRNDIWASARRLRQRVSRVVKRRVSHARARLRLSSMIRSLSLCASRREQLRRTARGRPAPCCAAHCGLCWTLYMPAPQPRIAIIPPRAIALLRCSPGSVGAYAARVSRACKPPPGSTAAAGARRQRARRTVVFTARQTTTHILLGCLARNIPIYNYDRHNDTSHC